MRTGVRKSCVALWVSGSLEKWLRPMLRPGFASLAVCVCVCGGWVRCGTAAQRRREGQYEYSLHTAATEKSRKVARRGRRAQSARSTMLASPLLISAALTRSGTILAVAPPPLPSTGDPALLNLANEFIYSKSGFCAPCGRTYVPPSSCLATSADYAFDRRLASG